MKYAVTGLICLCSVSQLSAQESDAFVAPEGSGSDSSNATSESSSKEGTTRQIYFEVSPSFANDRTADRGERFADAVTANKVGFVVQSEKTADFVFTGEARIAWNSDFEFDDMDEDNSSIIASGKLNWNRGFRRLSPFAKYQFEHITEGFLGDGKSHDHQLSAGLDIAFFKGEYCQNVMAGPERSECRKTSEYSVTVQPSIERLWSDVESRERWTPRVQANGSFKLVRGINFTASADYQYRLFDNDPNDNDHQHRLTLSGGIDFAGVLDSYLPNISTASVGVSWLVTENDNTLSDDVTNESRVTFAPAIRLTFDLP